MALPNKEKIKLISNWEYLMILSDYHVDRHTVRRIYFFICKAFQLFSNIHANKRSEVLEVVIMTLLVNDASMSHYSSIGPFVSHLHVINVFIYGAYQNSLSLFKNL